MSDKDQLRRLGELYGIEPDYIDIWGERRQVPDATERALLRAMGAAVGSAAEIAASLEEAEARPWRRMLAPVRVIAAEAYGGITVPFTLPDRHGGGAARWAVVEEAGRAHEGEVALDDLSAIAAATVGGEPYRRFALALPLTLPEGYHRLNLAITGRSGGQIEGSSRLIVAPASCFVPEDEQDGGRLWGVACQLYGVRSARNWGMGDLTDLGRLAEAAAALGAGALGVNPLHALFPADAHHISPYSPSSRFFLNVLYVDPEVVPDLAESTEARALLADAGLRSEVEQTRAAKLVDYVALWRLKLPVLERLFGSFQERHLDAPGSPRGLAFGAFKAERGVHLERHALFDALHEHAIQTHGAWSWQHWPEPYRHPDSPEVAAFAAGHGDRVEFFCYLQWLADTQLRDAQARARAAGMPIGLYQDIAVAVNHASSTTWANPGVCLTGASAGAPPDWFSPNGQDWALAPLSPVGLREGGYELFVETLRQTMRHAGAVRIDHVMGLQRLFWIPEGASPADGAYVRYPFDELARIIALESRRQRCLVIGEDLGTVPPGFRPAMQAAGLLSCRVLYFERDQDGGFLAPETYPERALVSVSTHDLPTLQGFWAAQDVRWRELLQLFPDPAASAKAMAERAQDRGQLLRALQRAGLLPAGLDPEQPPDQISDELVEAIHRFLARSPGHLLMVQLEDALGEVEQANLPGAGEHPNWQRKLPRDLEGLTDEPLVRRIVVGIGDEGRGRRARRS